MKEDQEILIPAYTGTEPFIFISYSHTDSELVQSFIRTMYEAGYRIWYDEGIKFNEDYQHTIQKKIREASYFIAFITERYLTRKDPLQEMLIAMDLRDKKKLKIIPIVLEPYNLEDLEKNANLFGSQTVEEAIGKLIYQGFKDIQGIISNGNRSSSSLITDVLSQIDESCRTTSDIDFWKKTVEEDTLEAYEKFIDDCTNTELVKLAISKVKKLIYKEKVKKRDDVGKGTNPTESHSEKVTKENLLVGSILADRYIIEKKIGKGGMSTVYKAFDNRLSKHWAIKKMRFTNNHNLFHNIAASEVILMNRFSHHSIPRIVDFINEKDTVYIVMDFIDGITLESILKMKGAMPEKFVLKVGLQLCEVLYHLHTRKPAVIYRDMKPSNISINKEGRITLFDFGIAREYKEDITRDTVNLGTIGYAAPEQFGGRSQTDARTDIFGLGMTLFYLLTNINPQGFSPGSIDFKKVNPRLSKKLEKIILKCTKSNPVDRYQSCEDLMNDLQIAMNDNPIYQAIRSLFSYKHKESNNSLIASDFLHEFFGTTGLNNKNVAKEDTNFYFAAPIITSNTTVFETTILSDEEWFFKDETDDVKFQSSWEGLFDHIDTNHDKNLDKL